MKKIFSAFIFLPVFAFAQNKVGINTKTPQATLHVNGDLKIVTAVALTTAAKAKDSIMVLEAGIVKTTTAANVLAQAGAASSATIGDVKAGVQSSDHGGWIKLDGRSVSGLSTTQKAAAATLGFATNLPDATGAVLMQSGNTLGNVSGSNSKTIDRANLPNVGITTSTDGAHTHTIPFNSVTRNLSWVTGSGGIAGYTVNGTPATTSNGDHSHSFNLNGNVTQTALDITPKSLSVNTFIYLGP